MAAQWAGRKGRRWREAKAKLHQTTQICVLCGHPGAFEAHHIPSRKALLAMGLDPNDLQYLHAAHGTSCRCPTCGQACNQVEGTGQGKTRMTCEW